MNERQPDRSNTRAGKASFLYDGHNRKPGVAAGHKDSRWRRLRRRMARWMRATAEDMG